MCDTTVVDKEEEREEACVANEISSLCDTTVVDKEEEKKGALVETSRAPDMKPLIPQVAGPQVQISGVQRGMEEPGTSLESKPMCEGITRQGIQCKNPPFSSPNSANFMGNRNSRHEVYSTP